MNRVGDAALKGRKKVIEHCCTLLVIIIHLIHCLTLSLLFNNLSSIPSHTPHITQDDISYKRYN